MWYVKNIFVLSKGIVLTKGRGNSKTPEMVVTLLKKAVAEKSQSAVSKETGLGLATINSYLRGVGEPTTNTLRKLADYFEVSIWELRGETPSSELAEITMYTEKSSLGVATNIDINSIDRKTKDSLSFLSKELILANLSKDPYGHLTEKRYSISFDIENGKIVGASVKPIKVTTDNNKTGDASSNTSDASVSTNQRRKRKADETAGPCESKSKGKKK